MSVTMKPLPPSLALIHGIVRLQNLTPPDFADTARSEIVTWSNMSGGTHFYMSIMSWI
jgi:hypothetical protein